MSKDTESAVWLYGPPLSSVHHQEGQRCQPHPSLSASHVGPAAPSDEACCDAQSGSANVRRHKITIIYFTEIGWIYKFIGNKGNMQYASFAYLQLQYGGWCPSPLLFSLVICQVYCCPNVSPSEAMSWLLLSIPAVLNFLRLTDHLVNFVSVRGPPPKNFYLSSKICTTIFLFLCCNKVAF